MTKREYHLMHFWFAKLSELQLKLGRPVTVGELARYVGQSRNTAMRYLDKLYQFGAGQGMNIYRDVVQFRNKTWGNVYSIDKFE